MTKAISFSNPETSNLVRYARLSAARGLPFVEKGVHADEPGAVVCALGHSLRDDTVFAEVERRAADGWSILGIKEAIRYVRDRGVPVRYSANMDPGANEVARTPVYDDVTYLLASTCHPELYDSILGGGARVEIFHSATGLFDIQVDPGFVLEVGPEDRAVHLGTYEWQTQDGHLFSPIAIGKMPEIEFYRRTFGIGDTVCGGYTVANRALAVLKYMGFEKIALAGCDFGWRPDETESHYADFVFAKSADNTFMNDDEGKIDGRPWRTRPDLMGSAVELAKVLKQDDSVEVLGDSLAKSLARHDYDFLHRVCHVER